MKWCTTQVDALGLETCLEGTPIATPLYEEWGFVKIAYVHMHFERTKPSEEWKQLVHEMQSQPICIMWRPVGGLYTEGKTVIPWVGKARTAKL